MIRDSFHVAIFWLALRLLTTQGATADERLQETRRILAGLEAVTVLAVDAAAGKAAVRIDGGGLVVAGKGEELPAGEAGRLKEVLRFRIVDVLPDRILVEELSGDGEPRATGRRPGRLIRIFKPERPGLDSRIEVLEREMPRPSVPDRFPSTELPAGAIDGDPGGEVPVGEGSPVRSALSASAGGRDEGGRKR